MTVHVGTGRQGGNRSSGTQQDNEKCPATDRLLRRHAKEVLSPVHYFDHKSNAIPISLSIEQSYINIYNKHVHESCWNYTLFSNRC